ncbi:hypothetical protein BDM02DRAFT_945183 [Thelephora ganbajun]|uniref:Uncharacterized protein n=1 Tax=Thelephora ganbajun TaxID=370292 RepID=A0ACB6Z4Q4_THEGA|nr:hypothetical protein BDM02DRAFT_945183 [Thelephora ganbajun]
MQIWPWRLDLKVRSVQWDLVTDGVDTGNMAAVNNERGSRVVLQDRSMDQRPLASGASTPTHRREDGVTGGYILLQLMRLISMILTVLREREHERQVPSDGPSEKISHNVPDLSSAESQSGIQSRAEYEAREMVTEQPPETHPERISENDHTAKYAHDAVQSGGSGGKSRYPGSILAWIDLH